MREGFSRKEVGKLLNISDRSVWFYTSIGLIKAEIHHPNGKGKTRLYSLRNVEQIRLIQALASLGLKLEEIGKLNLNEILESGLAVIHRGEYEISIRRCA